MTRKRWVVAGALGLLPLVGSGVFALTSQHRAGPSSPPSPVTTAVVTCGDLAATLSEQGMLEYRAQSDGSPYPVVNQSVGTYTALPNVGDEIACGGQLYRVNDKPILLLCGAVPAYRDVKQGDTGDDVRQLNDNLHQSGAEFTAATTAALMALQQANGLPATGQLGVGDAVFLPEAVRVADVTGGLGGAAAPGAVVLHATSDTLEVRLELDPSQRGAIHAGDHARITLPGNTLATGSVDRFGTIAAPKTQQDAAADPTLPVYIKLDDPNVVRGLDQAPVQVDIATTGVNNVLSVPVTAIVGKAGAGFAVEVALGDGRRVLRAVTPGLFDATAGRVEVSGDLRAGDRVVVPSS